MHDAVVPEDVVVEHLQVLDPVRHAGEIRVDRDRHDPGRRLALEVEAVELIPPAAQDLVRRLLLDGADDDVVDLDGVGHRDHAAGARLERHRLLVHHPVGDIFDAGFGQQVERLVGLGQPGLSQPRGGLP